MKRALRCDKMTLAALEASLRLYADPDQLAQKVPGIRLLTRADDDIANTARHVVDAVSAALGDQGGATVEPCQSQIGSGALPVDRLSSSAIVIRSSKRAGRELTRISRAFRQLPIPVVGRITDDAIWFDVRCLEEPDAFIENLKSLSLS